MERLPFHSRALSAIVLLNGDCTTVEKSFDHPGARLTHVWARSALGRSALDQDGHGSFSSPLPGALIADIGRDQVGDEEWDPPRHGFNGADVHCRLKCLVD